MFELSLDCVELIWEPVASAHMNWCPGPSPRRVLNMLPTMFWIWNNDGINVHTPSLFQRFEMYKLVDTWGDHFEPAWWLWSSYWLVAFASYIFLHPFMFQLFQNRLSFSLYNFPSHCVICPPKEIGPFEPKLKHLSCRESQPIPRVGLGRE